LLSTQEVSVTPTASAPTGIAAHGLGHLVWTGAARLRVLLLRGRLDFELGAGADPRSDPALRLRARRLVSPRYRRRLAVSLQRLVEELDDDSASYLSSAVPVQRQHVAAARGTLLALAGALRDVDSVNPRGVAMTLRLITDPASPLYSGTAIDLQSKAQSALDHLLAGSHPWCELPQTPPPPTPPALDGHR
jgi:hypothetical protein